MAYTYGFDANECLFMYLSTYVLGEFLRANSKGPNRRKPVQSQKNNPGAKTIFGLCSSVILLTLRRLLNQSPCLCFILVRRNFTTAEVRPFPHKHNELSVFEVHSPRLSSLCFWMYGSVVLWVIYVKKLSEKPVQSQKNNNESVKWRYFVDFGKGFLWQRRTKVYAVENVYGAAPELVQTFSLAKLFVNRE